MKDNYVLVTGYKDMNFSDKDGNKIDMVKVSFLSQNSGQDSFGYLPMQQSFMDKDKTLVLSSLKTIPGVYKADYDIVPGKNNKPSLAIVGFSFVKSADLTSFFKVG